jgi:hypothetical protein
MKIPKYKELNADGYSLGVILDILTFFVVIILMGIGYHDVIYPKNALVSGLRWWFLVGGFFLYMMWWNAYDDMKIRQTYLRPDMRPSALRFRLWWFRFRLRNPTLVGVFAPMLRLALLFALMKGISFLLQFVFAT